MPAVSIDPRQADCRRDCDRPKTASGLGQRIYPLKLVELVIRRPPRMLRIKQPRHRAHVGAQFTFGKYSFRSMAVFTIAIRPAGIFPGSACYCSHDLQVGRWASSRTGGQAVHHSYEAC